MAADPGNRISGGVDELFPLIFAFNHRPTTYLHESWVDQFFPAALWPLLSGSRRTQARLSAHVLERLGLADEVVLDFGARMRRVALVDGATLLRALRLVGIAANRSWLQKVIDRATVAKLHESVGADAYEFGLQRAPFLGFPSGPLFEEAPDPADYAGHFDRCGIAIAAAGLDGAPAGLIERLRLKLPAGVRFGADRVTLRHQPEAPERMLSRVITEIEPRWAKLFA